MIVKGIAGYGDLSQSSKPDWVSFASTMAASVAANILSDPVIFEKWPHYDPSKFYDHKPQANILTSLLFSPPQNLILSLSEPTNRNAFNLHPSVKLITDKQPLKRKTKQNLSLILFNNTYADKHRL